MRQLCNVAWAVQVEGLDSKEFKQFQKELNSDPTRGPISRGTGDLMGLFGSQAMHRQQSSKGRDSKPRVNPDRKAPRGR